MSFKEMFYYFWTFMIPIMVFWLPRSYMLYKLKQCKYKLDLSMRKKNLHKPTALENIACWIPFYNTWKQMDIITGKAGVYKVNMFLTIGVFILLLLSRIVLPLTVGATKLVGTIGLYTTFIVIFWILFTFLLSVISARVICYNFNGEKYLVWTWFFPVIAVFNVSLHLGEYFKANAEELGGVYNA